MFQPLSCLIFCFWFQPFFGGSSTEPAEEVTNEVRMIILFCHFPHPLFNELLIMDLPLQLGKFLPAENISLEILAREKEIQSHMMSKLDEVVIMKEVVSSKARTYLLEVALDFINLD